VLYASIPQVLRFSSTIYPKWCVGAFVRAGNFIRRNIMIAMTPHTDKRKMKKRNECFDLSKKMGNIAHSIL
jgi:hypothetical protein